MIASVFQQSGIISISFEIGDTYMQLFISHNFRHPLKGVSRLFGLLTPFREELEATEFVPKCF